jgi:hypothetical protein
VCHFSHQPAVSARKATTRKQYIEGVPVGSRLAAILPELVLLINQKQHAPAAERKWPNCACFHSTNEVNEVSEWVLLQSITTADHQRDWGAIAQPAEQPANQISWPRALFNQWIAYAIARRHKQSKRASGELHRQRECPGVLR